MPDDITTHCRLDYLPWEQRVTCRKCAAPLADNPLVSDALRMSNINAWAMRQLAILAEMAEYRELGWFADEARRVADGLMLLDVENKDPVARQPPCGHSHDFREFAIAAGFVAGVEDGSE